MCDRGAPKVRWMQSRDDDMSSKEKREGQMGSCAVEVI